MDDEERCESAVADRSGRPQQKKKKTQTILIYSIGVPLKARVRHGYNGEQPMGSIK